MCVNSPLCSQQHVRGEKVSADLFYYKKLSPNESKKIRTMITKDGMLFSFIDICCALEIKNLGEVTQYIDDNELRAIPIKCDNGEFSEVFIPEPVIYKLILRANTKYTQTFIEWLSKELLPSLRKDVAKFENVEEIINFCECSKER